MKSSAKFTFSVCADDRMFATALAGAVRMETLRLRFAGRETISLKSAPRANADIVVYGFDANAMDAAGFAEGRVSEIQRDRAKVKIFLQLRGTANADIDRKNRSIEAMARRCGAHLVTTADLLRSGKGKRMTKSGKPNLVGYFSIAHVVLRTVKTHLLRANISAGAAMPDAERAIAELTWDKSFLPASLEGNFTQETIQDFVDGWVIFPSFRSWGRFKLADPIDWGMEGANWSWQSYFTGLEFVRPALDYWYAHAHGEGNEAIADILKSRGLDANSLLKRSSEIIADFVRNNPPESPANQRAYFQGTICRRVKTLLTFLVCCGKARRMGLAVDQAEFALAIQGLSDSLEILKSDDTYPKAGNHGVRQDALFIAAGLIMPGNPYAKGLLQLGLDRLKRFQLDRVLLDDGVWQENSYGYHLLIMNVFQMLAGDLRRAGLGEASIFHDALRRMLPYAEGLIRQDGYGPLIGDTTPRRYFSVMSKVFGELKASGDAIDDVDLKSYVRAKETYYFPDGGYLASHSGRALVDAGSTMIFFATLSSKPKHKQSDDLSVIFSHGNTDLLIDGGTYNKEISDTIRNSARYDPASHNTFRVDGEGYPLRMKKGAKRAGLTGQWSGDGWAAARGFNDAYENARIERTAIHLKNHNAVIVFDEMLGTARGSSRFDQYWHISPDFQVAGGARNWTFTSKQKGTLLVAFDSEEADCIAGFGGPADPTAWTMQFDDDRIVPTPYLQRTKMAKNGRMASLFQWTENDGKPEIDLRALSKGGVEILARGKGFECLFLVAPNLVQLLAAK